MSRRTAVCAPPARHFALRLTRARALPAAVCKAEWAYEVDIVFKDLASFKGYMESDFRANVATPAFKKVTDLKPADAPEPYMGARVYDEK